MEIQFQSNKEESAFQELMYSELVLLFIDFIGILDGEVPYDEVYISYIDHNTIRASLNESPFSLVFSAEEQSFSVIERFENDFGDSSLVTMDNLDKDGVETQADMVIGRLLLDESCVS